MYICVHCGRTQEGTSNDRSCPACRPLHAHQAPPAPEGPILEEDPARLHVTREVGIPIRARKVDGSWGAVDLAHLTPASVLAWLRSRPPEFAERTVMMLLWGASAP